MIKAIVTKEWRQSLRQGHVRWVLAFALGLMLVSSVHTLLRYLDHQEIHTAASQASRENWLTQGEKNPHGAAHYGLHVFKPWQLGSIFDPGILPYTGTTVFVEAHVKNDAMHPPMADRTSLARWGNLSPAFILLYLVPLLMIVLHFNAISGERATKMHSWTASTGIPFRTWLSGKYVSAWALPLFFLVLCLGSVWAVSGFAAAELARVAWLMLGFGLFYGAILNGIFLVSSLIRTPASCLLILLGLWMAGSWMVPKMAASLAENKYPAPALAELRLRINEAMSKGLMGHGTSNERVDKLREEILAEYGVERVEDLPINFNAVAMQDSEEYGYEVFDHFYQQVKDQYNRQDGLFLKFGFLSPVLPASLFSMALSQTDEHAHWHFNRAVEMYRREFVEILNREMMMNSKTGDWSYRSKESTWEKVPEFQYESPSLAENLRLTKGSLGALSFWAIVSGVVLFLWIPAQRGWRA